MNDNMDRTAQFYSTPSYVGRGAGLPIFVGSRRQRGGSILGSVKSLVLPTLTSVGKTALKQAVGLAGDVASDIARGRNIRQSLKQHGLKRLKNVGKESLGHLASQLNPFSSSKRSTRKRTSTGKVPPSKRRRRGLF